MRRGNRKFSEGLRREDVERVLRPQRYETILLASEYLTRGKEMNKRKIGRLESLVGDYRRSSLAHHISRGLGIDESEEVHIGIRTESLI